MSSRSSPLTAALLTPRGRGAVATISIRGDHTILDRQAVPPFRAANGGPLFQQPFGRIVFGRWGREAGEDVVVCRVDAETLEIHCHGGERAAAMILLDWQRLGADVVPWQEQLRNGSGVLESELQECLSRSITWRTTKHLLHQADGRLRSAFQSLQEIAWSPDQQRAAQATVSGLLRWAEFGVHLAQPWRVVLTGPPNVGKSSLINALLGYQRSIVFDQPGTTRDVVTGETAFEGWPVLLTDTAGLREHAESMEAVGIARARQELATADLVIVLFDVSEKSAIDQPQDDLSLLPTIAFRRPPLFVAHKCDLPNLGRTDLPADALAVSSLTGAGLPELQQALVQRLISEVPACNASFPVTTRQVDSLRAALEALKQEDEVTYRAAASALAAS